MDSAADDLMTASIGRSPRNDTSGGSDPPGSSSGAQADLDGLPLDHATKPASTEAQLRQYEIRRIPSGYRPTGGRAQKTLITVNTVTQATVHLSKDTFPQHTVQSHKAAS
jgi:hypothetical protein